MEFNINLPKQNTKLSERLVFTFPQKSINENFGITEENQKTLVENLLSKVSNNQKLTPHQKTLILFGILEKVYTEITKPKSK